MEIVSTFTGLGSPLGAFSSLKGLPGFQFIQDPLDYSTRTHHSNIDVYDHVQAGDLMQAAAIVASFVYNAATRPEMLPPSAFARAEDRGLTSDDDRKTPAGETMVFPREFQVNALVFVRLFLSQYVVLLRLTFKALPFGHQTTRGCISRCE